MKSIYFTFFLISLSLYSNVKLTQLSTHNQPQFKKGFSKSNTELLSNGDFTEGLVNWNTNGTLTSEIINQSVKISNNETSSKYAGFSSNTINLPNGKYFIDFEVLGLENNSNVYPKFILIDRADNFNRPMGNIDIKDLGKKSHLVNVEGSGEWIIYIQMTNVDFSSKSLTIDNVSIKSAEPDSSRDKVVFDNNDFISGIPSPSGDFSYLITDIDIPNYLSLNLRIIGELSNNTARVISITGKLRVVDDENKIVFEEAWSGHGDLLVLVKQGVLRVFINGLQLGADRDVSGSSFLSINTIGNSGSSLNGSFHSIKFYDMAVTKFVNPPETPVFILSAEHQYHQADDGNPILNWYAIDNNIYLLSGPNYQSPLIKGDFNNELLQVNGELRVTNSIRTNEVNVQLQSAWPDYVFADDYQLPTIMEMSKHIKEHKHLPGVPSAADIAKDGLDMAKIMTAQMEKIEELSLYIIELEKKNQLLKKENHSIKNDLIPSILKRLQNLENK